ncbi:MAG TPA: hypothetical protein VGE74_22780 [Gemmata sp.]
MKGRKKRAGTVPAEYAKGYRLADHRVAPRRCLGPCGQVFPSNGPGNRICPECAAVNNGLLLSRRQS